MALQNLLSDPFGTTADPAAYCPRPATERVLAELVTAVTAGRPVAVVGPPGIGKTLLLHLLEGRLRRRAACAYVPNPTLAPAELAAWVLDCLSVRPGHDPLATLAGLVARRREAESAVLLLIDDADHLPYETARWLGERLAASAGGLRIALGALVGPATEAVCEAIGPGVRISELSEGLHVEEAFEYLAWRLELAGVPAETRARFDATAARRLCRIARGNPRRLNAAASALLRGDDPIGEPEPGSDRETDRCGAGPARRDLDPVASGSPATATAAKAPAPGPSLRSLVATALLAAALASLFPIVRYWFAPPALGDAAPAPAPDGPALRLRPKPPPIGYRQSGAGRAVADDPLAGARQEPPVPSVAGGDGRRTEVVRGSLDEGPAAARPAAPEVAEASAAEWSAPPGATGSHGAGRDAASGPKAEVADPAPQRTGNPEEAAPQPTGNPEEAAPQPAAAGERASPEPEAGGDGAPAGGDPAAPPASPAPPPGPIAVSIDARPWARIVIDGIAAGRTPLVGIQLSQGRHVFRARMADGRILQRVVDVDADNRYVEFE